MTAAETLDHCVVADAVNVGRVRQEFSRWLRQFGLDPDRHNDLVLAVNEALANVAEFAYLHSPTPGVVRFSARHDAATASLTVTVADDGRWRNPTASDIPDLRGRGIPLMRSLADAAEIDKSPTGTTVRLRFNGIGDTVGDMAGAAQV